jgi:hypothetical protein
LALYTTHVFKVDLLYYLGVDRGLISGERASLWMANPIYLVIRRQIPIRKGK